VGKQLHGAIVDAASQMTIELGWPGVTMAALAQRVGVSRQTVYNEIGNKSDLAEALVLSALYHYLELAETAFNAHPDNIVEGVRRAAKDLLTLATDDKLLTSTLAASHGGQSPLLSQLTTDAGGLLDAAQTLVMSRFETYDLAVTEDELAVAVDALVRLGLSTAMQPRGTPEQAADSLAWVADRLLA
jgi:AcrR family transcriptional regulator